MSKIGFGNFPEMKCVWDINEEKKIQKADIFLKIQKQKKQY